MLTQKKQTVEEVATPAAASAAALSPQPATIVVQGRGSVAGMPDQLSIALTIVSANDDGTNAASSNNRHYAQLLQALGPLGYKMTMELDDVTYPELPSAFFAGLGVDGKPDLWLRPSAVIAPAHVAFRAKTRADVDAFYAAALAAGATSNGAPGLRESYHPSYYAAYVLDPDGYNVEVVCHTA